MKQEIYVANYAWGLLETCPNCVWGKAARLDFAAALPSYLPFVLLPFVLVGVLSALLGSARGGV